MTAVGTRALLWRGYCVQYAKGSVLQVPEVEVGCSHAECARQGRAEGLGWTKILEKTWKNPGKNPGKSWTNPGSKVFWDFCFCLFRNLFSLKVWGFGHEEHCTHQTHHKNMLRLSTLQAIGSALYMGKTLRPRRCPLIKKKEVQRPSRKTSTFRDRWQ